MNYVYIGDEGTELRFDIGVDVSNVTLAKIYYKKPSGQTGSWTATLITGTTKIRYITQSDDIDETGDWTFQPYVELTSNWKGYGTSATLNVRKRYT